jgi:hypothetical protein
MTTFYAAFPLIVIEFWVVAAAAGIALSIRGGGTFWKRLESLLGGLARRRKSAILAAGLLPVALRLLLLPAMPPRVPAIHDEFSFLLAGDTFAHGRAANPPHPMWEHFESFHILQQPTYASMEPPAQGLLLAIPMVFGLRPWVGVALGIGLMCAAICWMLQGWFPPGWALFGAALVGIRIGVVSYWMNSFQGGAAAAIGGALVLGALPRLQRRGRVADALALALGVGVLANSRPFEGMLFCIAPAAVAIAWAVRKRAFRAVAALALAMACIGCLMAWYNWRVTGNPAAMPHQFNRDAYAVIPNFVWQSLRPIPAYRHETMRKFYAEHDVEFWRRQVGMGLPMRFATKAFSFWIFYLGPVFSLTVLGALPCLLRSRRMRLFWVVMGVTWAGLLGVVYTLSPHYAAPLTAPLFALIVQSMRYARSFRWRNRRVGLYFVRTVPIVCLLMTGISVAARPLGIVIDETATTWYANDPGNVARAETIRDLEALGGKHLVVVRYGPSHDLDEEWVYNGADIDGAAVVWARGMSPAEDGKLLEYFKDRKAWALEPDRKPVRLTPYR